MTTPETERWPLHALAVVVITLVVCEGIAKALEDVDPTSVRGADLCLRRELFVECLEKAGTANEAGGFSNGEGDVVQACESYARRASLRQKQFIQPKCWGYEGS